MGFVTSKEASGQKSQPELLKLFFRGPYGVVDHGLATGT